jgi:ADP-heptose:LPS heptosyltransferase
MQWLVNPEWAPILEGNRDIDEVIEFPRKRFSGPFGWMRLRSWLRELRGRVQPDLTLDFQGLLRSALVARGVGGDSWGTSDSRECARFLHRHVVPVPPRSDPTHAVRRYLALVAALGCDSSEPLEWRIPVGTPPAGCPAEFVLLHPFSRGEDKSLSAEEVAAFCRDLAPVPVVIAGRSAIPISPPANATSFLNQTTLAQLCWLLRQAKFVVSVDSGPMHIAAAVSAGLLSIHTWSDPRKVGPFRPEAWVWKDSRVARMADYPSGTDLPRNEIGRWVAAHLRRSARTG